MPATVNAGVVVAVATVMIPPVKLTLVTVPLPFVIPGIKTAALSTGGAIVSGAAYDPIDADMVDMETFACLRACQLFGVPLIGLRGISDGAADLRHVNDWTEYLHVIDEKLAAAVGLLEQAIVSRAIRLA